MNRTLVSTLVAILPLTVALGGCATLANIVNHGDSSKRKGGLSQAEELIEQVARVHVECELSKQRVRQAVETLHDIVAPDFQGDAVAAYAGFLETIERSEEQNEELRDAVEDMEDAAGPFFEKWTSGLQAFTSAGMRHRSQVRLDDTRERYQKIVAVVEPAQSNFVLFNLGLRDHALFLGHDFNAMAVAEIEGEISALTGLAIDLNSRFDDCLVAVEKYVEAAGIPTDAEDEVEEPAHEREADRERTSKPRAWRKE